MLTSDREYYTYWTDGACSNNKKGSGIGGWCVVELVPCDEGYRTDVKTGSKANTTNNEMELTAVYKAMLHTYKKGGRKMTIFSDSMYCINPIVKNWLLKWKQNDWIKSDGKPVLNAEIWKKIYKLIFVEGLAVEMVYTRGHKSDVLNKLADDCAVFERKMLAIKMGENADE